MPDLLLWILASLELVIGLGWIFLLFYNARELSSYPNFVLEGPTTRNEEEVVTVIVPTRNEEATIARCLRSIAGQTHRNLEFVSSTICRPTGLPRRQPRSWKGTGGVGWFTARSCLKAGSGRIGRATRAFA